MSVKVRPGLELVEELYRRTAPVGEAENLVRSMGVLNPVGSRGYFGGNVCRLLDFLSPHLFCSFLHLDVLLPFYRDRLLHSTYTWVVLQDSASEVDVVCREVPGNIQVVAACSPDEGTVAVVVGDLVEIDHQTLVLVLLLLLLLAFSADLALAEASDALEEDVVEKVAAESQGAFSCHSRDIDSSLDS